MSLADRLRRVPFGGWAAIFAVAMILPGLGGFGFWDPWELGVADRAREIARSGNLLDPTVSGRFGAEPPLDLFLSALGMKVFGAGELGARLLGALCGVLAILAVYWGGRGMFRPRAGLLGALALGTMPLFVFQTRQLSSDMPLVAGLALSMAGLGRFAWPASGRRSPRDLLVAAAGLAMGLFSGGALIGVALPCLALVGAVAVGWGLRPDVAPRPVSATAALTLARVGRDIPAGLSFGAALLAKGTRGRAPLVLLALLGLGLLVLTLTTANVAGKYSLLLGGTPRAGTPAQTFEFLAKQIGFGVFPWSALVVFALGRALIRLGGTDEPAVHPQTGSDDGSQERPESQERSEDGRLAFGQIYLLLFAAFALALCTVFVLMTGDARFPALAPLALAVGVFLDEALEGRRSEPVLGLLIATGTMVVARDFFLAPEELASVHLLGAKVKWPPTLTIGPVFLVAGFVVGAGVYSGLATRGRALGHLAPRQLEAGARAWRRKIEAAVVGTGRFAVHAAVVAALLFGAFLSHALLPMLSRHLSFKPVLESYARFAKDDEEIAKYRVEGHGTGFYSRRTLADLASQDQVVGFLRRPKRAFCLVSAEELAALDAAFKLAKLDYFVVDASSSRFLLLSNQLRAGEEERNPLKKDVWMAPRLPDPLAPGAPPVVPAVSEGARDTVSGAVFNWHGQSPPWKWRVPVYAVYENAVELVGADFPTSVRRPGKIPMTLYFRVAQRPPAGFKIFAHFDTPGEPRVIGDHAPLGGAFPTAHWLPGEYIRDHHDVDVPLMTTPAGTYTLLIGFWPGGEAKRWRITAGANDGADRARIGTIEIR